jgi:hypothetical protein
VTGGGAEAGTWNVSVTTPGGTSASNAGDDFTYLAVPAVSKVSPNPGPVRWRGCRHTGLASFPVGPLVFGEGSGRGARYFGPGYPSSTGGATPLTYELPGR